MFTVCKLVQPLNVPSLSSSILLEIVALPNEVQPENDFTPIFVTVFGIFTESKEAQFSKADSSISVTPSGIMIEASILHPLNADSSICTKLVGNVIEVKLLQS